MKGVRVSEPASLLLPEQTRLVHIGPPKTGSTALQVAMASIRPELRSHGVHYAGPGHRPQKAGWAMLGIGRPVGRRQPTMQHWDDLVREVEEAGDLRVCISNEDFAKAAGDKAARVVDDLGGDRVHVLAVARRLDRLLPSWWQERVKARLTMSYEDWLELVLRPESKQFEWRNLWVSQDFEKLVDRWTRRNGPESFTFVVSDDTDQQLLPRTIEGMLGLPRGLVEVGQSHANRSLSMWEADLVRRLNQVFRAHKWDDDHYLNLVQVGVVKQLKEHPKVPGDRPLPPLPSWAAERVAEISNRMVDAIESSGVNIVGDAATLRPPSVEAMVEPPLESTDIPVELAVRALEGSVLGSLRLEDVTERRRARRAARRTAPVSPEARAVTDTTSADLLRVVGRRAARRLGRGKRS
jgi:hypothetical protein